MVDLKVVKRDGYCWYLNLYLKIMGDSVLINETVGTIDILIVSAIEQLKKNKKRSDEHRNLTFLQNKRNSINQRTLSLSIASLIKNGIILTKSLNGKNSYSDKSSLASEKIAGAPTPLENRSIPSSSAPNESRVLFKSHDNLRIEQIEN